MKIYGNLISIEKTGVEKLPKEVIKSIIDNVNVLENNYNPNRNILKDDGGYCVVIESESDILNFEVMTNIEIGKNIEENRKEICRKNWFQIDYITNNETMITVFIRKKLYDLCLPFWNKVVNILDLENFIETTPKGKKLDKFFEFLGYIKEIDTRTYTLDYFKRKVFSFNI